MEIRDLRRAPIRNADMWRFVRVMSDDYSAYKRAKRIAEAELVGAEKRNFQNIDGFGRVSCLFGNYSPFCHIRCGTLRLRSFSADL